VCGNVKNRVIGTGKIASLNISDKKGVVKRPVPEVTLVEDWGISGDAHAGKWHRQVSMLSLSSVEKARSWGIDAKFGDFAENITIEGVDVWKLPIGTLAQIGDTVMEVTQIGKECHSGCEIARKTGKCVMPLEGIFLKVIKGGVIKTGDSVIFYSKEKGVSTTPSLR